MIAFYTLPDDDLHLIRRALIYKLKWALALLLLVLFGIAILSFARSEMDAYFDVSDLSVELDKEFSACYFVGMDAYLSNLFSEDRDLHLADALSICFRERTGQDLPRNWQNADIKSVFKVSIWTGGRLAGLFASLIGMTLILFLAKNKLLVFERAQNQNVLVNSFVALFVGIILQILLQGAGDLFVYRQ